MKTLVRAALVAAIEQEDEGANLGAVHRNRSRNFVECLATEFRRRYPDRDDVAVFSKHFVGNRQRHGLNELMFDVAVCETRRVPSASGRAELTFVSSLLVAIESELAANSREALYDFSKLVMGRALTSLFIGPCSTEEERYLAALGPAADCCAGTVLVALIPRPASWSDAGGVDVRLWRRMAGTWMTE